MPGPRIYTEAWERLKVAAKETETREVIKEVQPMARAPEKTKRLRAPRISVIAIGVLSVLIILTASLWIDSQARLLTVAGDLNDLRSRLALLQDKMKKVEDEKQRLEEENTTLSKQYEQRAAEFAQVQDELNESRPQKDRSRMKAKPSAATAENASVNPPVGSKSVHESASPQTAHVAPKLQKQEQQDVKVYKID